MPFQKGHKLGIGNKYRQGIPAWNKGFKIKLNTGRTHFKKGMIPWNKNKEFHLMKGENNPAKRIETRKKIGEALKGKKKNYEVWNKGKKGLVKMSSETRKKQSEIQKKRVRDGLHHLWRGGIMPINRALRVSLDYKLWREAVLKRDKFECVWCGSSIKLQADHIKPFALFPELRFAIDNGRTLCRECHRKTDTWGNKNSTNKLEL